LIVQLRCPSVAVAVERLRRTEPTVMLTACSTTEHPRALSFGCEGVVVNWMTEVPASVRPLFVAAGWRSGRTVALSPAPRADHPAAAILAEFGGLTVGQTGAGEECARSDITFRQLPPDDLILDVWGKLLRTQLIGVADVHHAHAELYMDSAGRCFVASIVDDGFYFEGASFSEAIERLLLGRRSRPMLRPFQDTIGHYGEEIRADDPRVYKYR
jgi:hypothetical protein